MESHDRRDGEAWWVRSDPDRPFDERFGAYRIDVALYAALFDLRIVDAFHELPHELLLGAYEEGIVLNRGLPEASRIVRERARESTAGDALRALADFLDEGYRQGYDVQFWL